MAERRDQRNLSAVRKKLVRLHARRTRDLEPKQGPKERGKRPMAGKEIDEKMVKELFSWRLTRLQLEYVLPFVKKIRQAEQSKKEGAIKIIKIIFNHKRSLIYTQEPDRKEKLAHAIAILESDLKRLLES